MDNSKGTIQSALNLWSIILSGGDGERMRPCIEQGLGRHVPKQYCTFVGTRSMLQHTLDRADRLTNEHHKVTVMARSHQAILGQRSHPRSQGRFIYQPENRGTAAGVFLPLTHIRSINKEAVIIIYPADHFIYPEVQFLNQVSAAVRATEHWTDRIVLLGVPPTRMEAEYGWIEKGNRLGWASGTELYSVNAFEEKPTSRLRWSNLAGGYLWNTMIVAAKLETLWSIGWQRFPDIMERFRAFGDAINTPREGAVLDAIYQDMPRRDFSTHVLGHTVHQLAVMELQNILWSDWGKPNRIVETLREIGKEATFPFDHLPSFETTPHYKVKEMKVRQQHQGIPTVLP